MTLTFTPLEPKGGRELKHTKAQWFLSTFVLGPAMIARQPQMLQMSVVETGQMYALATEDMSAVETGPMSAAETGHMSAVETRQMSVAETGQMSVVETRQMYISNCLRPSRHRAFRIDEN